MQQDPFQEFASPYVGMGNDPVNNTDPSGGILCPGASKLAVIADAVWNTALTAVQNTSPFVNVLGVSIPTLHLAATIMEMSITASTINGPINSLSVGKIQGASTEKNEDDCPTCPRKRMPTFGGEKESLIDGRLQERNAFDPEIYNTAAARFTEPVLWGFAFEFGFIKFGGRALNVASKLWRTSTAAKGVGALFQGGRMAKASELVAYAEKQGWKALQNTGGPLKYIDENGIIRMTIKQGSQRATGSGFPHVELRNSFGKRIDVFGNDVTRKSLGNHTEIIFDLK